MYQQLGNLTYQGRQGMEHIVNSEFSYFLEKEKMKKTRNKTERKEELIMRMLNFLRLAAPAKLPTHLLFAVSVLASTMKTQSPP